LFRSYAANQIAGTVTAYDYFVESTTSCGFYRSFRQLYCGRHGAGSPYAAGAGPSARFLALRRFRAVQRATSCVAADANSLFVANAGSSNITVFCMHPAADLPLVAINQMEL
jgi:hypothetical protein